jgi:hypothetical protein
LSRLDAGDLKKDALVRLQDTWRGASIPTTTLALLGIATANSHTMQIQHPEKEDYVFPSVITLTVKAKRPSVAPLVCAGSLT